MIFSKLDPREISFVKKRKKYFKGGGCFDPSVLTFKKSNLFPPCLIMFICFICLYKIPVLVPILIPN